MTMNLLVFPAVVVLASALVPATGYRSPGASRTLPAAVRAAVDPEKVYSREEVDKPAEMKNDATVLPAVKKSLECEGDGTIKFSFVMRKSGKVTDIKIENSMTCSGSKAKATSILGKLKFTPAMKDKVRVSQSETIELEVKTITSEVKTVTRIG